uniref:VWFA domain-containing protein n=1 Tax=Haplochromis burtoni TaxID=8153 RepID=A0A3Q3BUM8_HAPBU
MKTYMMQNMQRQGGSLALGQMLDYTLREVLLKAGQSRSKRAVLTVVGTKTAYRDQAKLRYISQKAKCEGVALFVVAVGDRYNRMEVEELASVPIQQHLIRLDRLKADEQGYAQRFIRVFLSALNSKSTECRCSVSSQGSADWELEISDQPRNWFQEQTGILARNLSVINTLSKRKRSFSGCSVTFKNKEKHLHFQFLEDVSPEKLLQFSERLVERPRFLSPVGVSLRGSWTSY